MKKFVYYSFLLFFIVACNNEKDKPVEEASAADINAVTSFVNAALKGDFNEARKYTVKDSTNLQFLDLRERIYGTMPGETKQQYANSTMRVFGVNRLNDSTTIIVYANSFKNDRDTLRVLKQNNEWLVDVKYIWLHDTDTMQLRSKADTLTEK